MTGTLTLKRRFLEENASSANFGSQKLQFLKNITNFWKFRSVTSLSIVLVSGETLSTKNFPLLGLGTFCNQNSYNFWPIR